MIPIAKTTIASHINNPFDPCLVLEGSALLPELASTLDSERVTSIWLTLPDDVVCERIYDESRYDRRSAEDQALINRFCDRTVAFSRWLGESAVANGFTLTDATSHEAHSILESLLRDST